MEKDVYVLELFIARFLRYGVLLAGGLLVVGWLSQINFSQDTFAQFQVYHETRLLDLIREVWSERRWGLLTSYVGLLVLISLPMIRVLMTFAVFLRKRDYALAFISMIVIFGLTLSVVLGFQLL